MAQQVNAGPIQARSKGEIKRLRREGYVPISIQHRGEETIHLQGEAKPLDEFIRQYGESTFLDLVIAPHRKRQTVLIKEVQRDPISRTLLQVTFQSVVRGEPIKAHVPLVFHGEPEAVRLHTALVQHQLERLEIRCLPRNMPDHITVDISHLNFGELVRVSDLPATDRYEILTSPDTVLASLTSLAAAQAEAAAEEAAEKAVPEEAAAPAGETAEA